MAQPFKSQLIPSSFLTANTTMLLGFLAATGYLITHAETILQTLATLDFNLYGIATQAIQQLTQL